MFCLSAQEEEFKWLLREEVHAVLQQLQDILKVVTFLSISSPLPPITLSLPPAHQLVIPWASFYSAKEFKICYELYSLVPFPVPMLPMYLHRQIWTRQNHAKDPVATGCEWES